MKTVVTVVVIGYAYQPCLAARHSIYRVTVYWAPNNPCWTYWIQSIITRNLKNNDHSLFGNKSGTKPCSAPSYRTPVVWLLPPCFCCMGSTLYKDEFRGEKYYTPGRVCVNGCSNPVHRRWMLCPSSCRWLAFEWARNCFFVGIRAWLGWYATWLRDDHTDIVFWRVSTEAQVIFIGNLNKMLKAL